MGVGWDGGVRESIVVEAEDDMAVEVAEVAWGAVVAVVDRYLEGITVQSNSLSSAVMVERRLVLIRILRLSRFHSRLRIAFVLVVAR